jgi:hypothetical protein
MYQTSNIAISKVSTVISKAKADVLPRCLRPELQHRWVRYRIAGSGPSAKRGQRGQKLSAGQGFMHKRGERPKGCWLNFSMRYEHEEGYRKEESVLLKSSLRHKEQHCVSWAEISAERRGRQRSGPRYASIPRAGQNVE